MYAIGKDTPATQLVIAASLKDVMPQLGMLYILLAYFVIVGTSNAVKFNRWFRWLSHYAYGVCSGAGLH